MCCRLNSCCDCCIQKSCCGCCKVETGCKIIAIFEAFVSFVGVFPVYYNSSYGSLAGTVIGLAIGAMLYYAVKTKDRCLLIVYIVISAIRFTVGYIAGICMIVAGSLIHPDVSGFNFQPGQGEWEQFIHQTLLYSSGFLIGFGVFLLVVSGNEIFLKIFTFYC